ncbi:MAG: hypothetical protein LUH58_08440 [Lachnospiraceae bacterium]|nr:hypothetical protein [Lachnospiraceae bacterium]
MVEKENAKLSAAQKAAQKKYDEKTKMISVKYTPVDMADYEKMRSFLDESGQSANQFIKKLIHDYFDPETKAAKEEENRAAEPEKPAAQSISASSVKEREGAEGGQEGKPGMGVLPEWLD